MYHFQCRYCEEVLSSEYNHIGDGVKCPSCDSEQIVQDELLDSGTLIHGFVIQSCIRQTDLFSLYIATGVENLPGVSVILMIPSMFMSKHATDYDAFCSHLIVQGSEQNSLQPPLLEFDPNPSATWFAYEYHNNSTFLCLDTSKKASTKSEQEALDIIRLLATDLNTTFTKTRTTLQNLCVDDIEILSSGKVYTYNFSLSNIIMRDKALKSLPVDIWDYRYTSPEFMESGTTNNYQTDIYSLGGILYYLLTGEHPHNDADDPKSIINEPTIHLNRTRLKISDKVYQLFEKMFDRYPFLRQGSYGELLDNIDYILNKGGTPSVPMKRDAIVQAQIDDWSNRKPSPKAPPRKKRPAQKRPINASRPKVGSRKKTKVARPISQKKAKGSNQQLLIAAGLLFTCILIAVIVVMNIKSERKIKEMERLAQNKIRIEKNKAIKAAKKEAAIRRQKERLEKATKRKLIAKQLAAKRALLQAQIAANNFKKEQSMLAVESGPEEAAQEHIETNESGGQTFEAKLEKINQQYQSNPNDYDTVITSYEALVKKALQQNNFEQLKTAQTKLDSVVEQRDEKNSEIMAIIKNTIRPMIQAEDFAGAIKFLEDYTGEGSSLTQERRDGIIKLLQRKLNGE